MKNQAKAEAVENTQGVRPAMQARSLQKRHDLLKAGRKLLHTRVLEEISIDIGGLHPKSVDLVDPENFDKIISMGCGVSCPALPIDEDWGLEDPFGREIEAYRITRDEIRARVNAIVDRGTDA